MKIKGPPDDIRRPDDWWDYVDWQKGHLSLQGDSVVCAFEDEYIIPLSRCQTPTSALIEAFTLMAWLEEHEPHAFQIHIAKYFLDLIRERQKLPHDLSKMFEELANAFSFQPRKKSTRS